MNGRDRRQGWITTLVKRARVGIPSGWLGRRKLAGSGTESRLSICFHSFREPATTRQARIHALEGKPYFPDRLLQPEDVADVVLNVLTLPRSAEVFDQYFELAEADEFVDLDEQLQ